MNGWDVWDVVLFLLVGYLAVMALVRLMAAHRQRLTGELQRQQQLQRLQQKQEKKRAAEKKPAA